MQVGKFNGAKIRGYGQKVRAHSVRAAKAIHHHTLSSKKRIIISVLAVLVVPIILIQLFYPADSLLPNTKVGSVSLGAVSKADAAKQLDKAYASAEVPIYFAESDKVIASPSFADLGVKVSNEPRVAAYDYPVGMRLIPWSLFWYQSIVDKGDPSISRDDEVQAAYIVKQFGEDCKLRPVNGTIVYVDSKLQVEKASQGGTCDTAEVKSKLKEISVRLQPERVTIAGSAIAPEVSTEDAQAEYVRLTTQLAKGVNLKVQDKTEVIKGDVVAPWVEYSVREGALVLGLNGEKARQWLDETYAKKFAVASGTTTVSTYDFTETARTTGKSGQALNSGATVDEIIKELSGKADVANLVISPTEPKVTYTRSYSATNTGLSAVMKNYADTHPGTYGVKMIELSGERRNAEYNSKTQFVTASTYKMFVAYSILLRIERGEMQWTDGSYGGQNISVCFDKMIKQSNNECAEDLLYKVGFAGLTNDARAIGATSTSFLGNGGVKSTANDEAILLSSLYSGQILAQQASRDRFIDALKGNIFRKGIPAGIPNVTVAGKVGFLDALLHDAAIVYSPKGTYVLVILTNNATWGDIAELAKQIESVR